LMLTKTSRRPTRKKLNVNTNCNKAKREYFHHLCTWILCFILRRQIHSGQRRISIHNNGL
jgi:hypothetical protein